MPSRLSSPFASLCFDVERDEVGEREAVVRGDEVHRPRRRPRAAGEDVGRAGEARRELAREPRVAAPESPRRVAVAVVPFAPGRRERAEAMAARPDVPRLGDELEVAQHRILRDRLQQRRGGVEAEVEPVGAAAERGREVEAEAVDARGLGVVAQDVHREAQRRRPVEGERVAAAGVVEIARAVVGEGPVVGRVVEAAQRQRRPEGVAFAAVVEHDVEDDLDAGGVQRGDAGGELGDAAGGEPRVGDEQRDGVVAPVVGQALPREVALVDRRRDGHQLDGRDAEPGQVRDRGGMGEAGAGAAQRVGHVRMRAREAAHMEFVQDRLAPRHPRPAGGRRGRRRRDDRAWHERRAVGRVGGRVVRACAEHRRMQRERPGRALSRTGRRGASPALKRWPARGSYGPCARSP